MGMRFGDLKEEIRDLGFEEDATLLEYESILIHACNRAMRLISSTVKPIVKKYVISKVCIKNELGDTFSEQIYRGEKISYGAKAKAFYFEACGKGMAEIRDEDGIRNIPLESESYVPYKGFLRGRGTITFSGEYLYQIRNIAMYDCLMGPDEEDIPVYAKKIRYDLLELTREAGEVAFDGFARENAIINGNIAAWEREGDHTIALEYEDAGEIQIWYKKRPKTLSKDTPNDFPIELDPIVQPLLPLLASHYIWLDDEERKATLYWNEYDDLKEQIMMGDAQKVSALIGGGV